MFNDLSYPHKIHYFIFFCKLKICEPHCDLTYFKNAQKISTLDKLFEIATKDIVGDYKILFTDKGSKKRYSYLKGESVYAQKTRDLQSGLINGYKIVGSLKGVNNLVVVDDIISTGDTIIKAIENADIDHDCKIYIVCAHFEKNKYNKRIFDIDNLVSVYSTNSLSKRATCKKLKLINILEVIK